MPLRNTTLSFANSTVPVLSTKSYEYDFLQLRRTI